MSDKNFILNQLIKDIKKKKELTALSDAFILTKLKTALEKNSKLDQKLAQLNQKSADYKKIIKFVRAELRHEYGLFRINQNSLMILLKQLESNPCSKDILSQILKLHSSTRERLPYYEQLYQQLFSKTNPKTILDLGCGLNPFSLPLMNLKYPTYYAYDLSKTEIAAI